MSSNAPDTMISVQNAGKFYPIYRRPQDRLKQALFRGRRQYYKAFWALRKVSFDVARGESVGIIGRNGSGKSTLLQMIAGTLTPTEGEVHVRGRMAALLQLGSGFNPEFTGRENVFMNASILGLNKREIEQRYESIIDFADIGEYINQPVKTYSSGMYARLAFSVAVSVDPDVLIVDEILSVGDIGFQQKCVARMRKMREEGLTFLFVSHSPDSVRSICQKALFLSEGQPIYYGPAETAVNLYLNHIRQQANAEVMKTEKELSSPIAFKTDVPGQMRYGTGHVQIQQVTLLNEQNEAARAFQFGEKITVKARIKSFVDARHLSLSFLIRDMTGIDLMGTTSFDEGIELPSLNVGEEMTIDFSFTNVLRAGNFGVCLAVNRISKPDKSDVMLLDQVDGVAAFSVLADPERPIHYKFHNPVEIKFMLEKNTSVESSTNLQTSSPVENSIHARPI